MSSIKFNTLVVSTYEGEILDVIVGTDSHILSQLKETQYWDDMVEEAINENKDVIEFDVQSLSDYYKENLHNSSLGTRVTYFPNKILHHR